MTFPTKSPAVREDSQEALLSRTPSSSDLGPVRLCLSWLTHGPNGRWALLIIGSLLSLESFFVRELVSALLLFTAVFAVAAMLIALSFGIGYGTDLTISWVGSQVRSIHFAIHHSLALPTQCRTAGSDCTMPSFKRSR